MTKARPDILRAVVVVPVHNEELVLDACVSALVAAATRSEVDTDLILVLDTCSDSSKNIVDDWAARTAVHTVAVDRRNVGAARAAGFLAAETSSNTWFATTDADSVVRPDWLSSQLEQARRGADVVAGTVVPDPAGLTPQLAATYSAGYRNRPGHGHVHGANLGMRADAYWSVGGFAALRTGEDVDLVRRLGHAGVPIRYTCDSPVRTSARRIGRAPDGFAAHLSDLELTGLELPSNQAAVAS